MLSGHWYGVDRLMSSGSVTVAAIAAVVWALADPDADPSPDATLAHVGFAGARAVRDLAAAVCTEFADEFSDLPVVLLGPAMSVDAFAEAMCVALAVDEQSGPVTGPLARSNPDGVGAGRAGSLSGGRVG